MNEYEIITMVTKALESLSHGLRSLGIAQPYNIQHIAQRKGIVLMQR